MIELVNGSPFDTVMVYGGGLMFYGAIAWWIRKEFAGTFSFLFLLGFHVGAWLLVIPIGAINEVAAGFYGFILGIILYALPAYLNRNKRGGTGGGF